MAAKGSEEIASCDFGGLVSITSGDNETGCIPEAEVVKLVLSGQSTEPIAISVAVWCSSTDFALIYFWVCFVTSTCMSTSLRVRSHDLDSMRPTRGRAREDASKLAVRVCGALADSSKLGNTGPISAGFRDTALGDLGSRGLCSVLTQPHHSEFSGTVGPILRFSLAALRRQS